MKKVLAINNQYAAEVNRKYGLTSGVSYYRQVMPGKHLDGYEFHHRGHELLDLNADNAERIIGDMVKGHDVIFSKHLDNPAGIYMLLGACDFYDKPLIIDFDDDVFATDGKEHNLYVYPEGSDEKHYLEVLIKEASAITVSTEPLLDVYKFYNKNVYLCPNAVDTADWNVKKASQKRPTVLWMASTGHIVDHKVFEPVMQEIVRRRPHTVFTAIGHYLPEHMTWLPRKNWELKPGTTWWDGNPEDPRTYPSVLAGVGADIGVAPLTDSRYNNARSLAKWFEYTMTDTPMVASNYGPYTHLTPNEAALVETEEEWVEAIINLLDNKDERERLVRNSRDRIDREFTIERTIASWRTAFEETRTFNRT